VCHAGRRDVEEFDAPILGIMLWATAGAYWWQLAEPLACMAAGWRWMRCATEPRMPTYCSVPKQQNPKNQSQRGGIGGGGVEGQPARLQIHQMPRAHVGRCGGQTTDTSASGPFDSENSLPGRGRCGDDDREIRVRRLRGPESLRRLHACVGLVVDRARGANIKRDW
jgi:hypothetical protein